MDLTATGRGAGLVLRDGEEELARISFTGAFGADVAVGGRELRVVPYMPGVHLALVEDDPDEPLAWYAGGTGFGAGRLVVAPDSEYRLRSRFPLGVTWRLTAGRHEVLRITARRRFPDASFAVTGDAGQPAVLLACVVVAQLMRERA